MSMVAGCTVSRLACVWLRMRVPFLACCIHVTQNAGTCLACCIHVNSDAEMVARLQAELQSMQSITQKLQVRGTRTGSVSFWQDFAVFDCMAAGIECDCGWSILDIILISLVPLYAIQDDKDVLQQQLGSALQRPSTSETAMQTEAVECAEAAVGTDAAVEVVAAAAAPAPAVTKDEIRSLKEQLAKEKEKTHKTQNQMVTLWSDFRTVRQSLEEKVSPDPQSRFVDRSICSVKHLPSSFCW